MNRPLDGTPLAMTERQAIEIDPCPQCRDVRLDHSGLDKLIEPSRADAGAHEDEDEPRPEQRSRRSLRKRRSILEGLFEFGG